MDITWFPFDQQNCSLKFGTWTYHEALVNLTLKDVEADTSSYQQNAEWQLISAFATRNSVKYACCPEVFLDVTFEFIIQRKTIYYFNNLIIPCIIIASMVIFGFHTPPDSGEKLTLCITILMSLTFFMNMVSSMMPPTSETPLIGTYFSCIMVMVACSVVCTVLILNYHKRTVETHVMPAWVETVFLNWLPWLLRMEHPGPSHSLKTLLMEHKLNNLEKGDRTPSNLMPDILYTEEDFLGKINSFHLTENISDCSRQHRQHQLPSAQGQTGGQARGQSWRQSLQSAPARHGPQEREEREGVSRSLGEELAGENSVTSTGLHDRTDVQKIYKEILVISNKIKQDQQDNEVAAKWKMAAMVFD